MRIGAQPIVAETIAKRVLLLKHKEYVGASAWVRKNVDGETQDGVVAF